MVTPTSRPDWRDLALNTSALGSSPDSIRCSLTPPFNGLLQATPPRTTFAVLSQVFQVAKPFTLPENETSQAPPLRPTSACAQALPRARAAAAASATVLRFITGIVGASHQ